LDLYSLLNSQLVQQKQLKWWLELLLVARCQSQT
jgi:hypothetical protein